MKRLSTGVLRVPGPSGGWLPSNILNGCGERPTMRLGVRVIGALGIGWASAVDRCQSALLVAKWLIQDAADRYDFTKWPELYRLAEEAQVNISNLTVRLQRLGLIYLRDGDKTIYRSKDERSGQKGLF